MSWRNEISQVLPPSLNKLLEQIEPEGLQTLEEIRIRIGQPVIFNFGFRDHLTDHLVTLDEIEQILQMISNCSLYAFEEELKNGFITIVGGHRVGITGKAVLDQGKVKSLKYLNGFNFRICKEFPGAADQILPYVVSEPRQVKHTLIISPPCCGKTTLLRDIIRQLSLGIPWLRFQGVTVGVVDERSELAGAYQGRPQKDLGPRADVLDSCPKAEGMLMLVRAMGPQVIATDELGKKEDIEALQEVLNAGIKIVSTVHGSSLNDLRKRPAFKYLLEEKIFELFIILGRSRGIGTIEDIIDGVTEKSLWKR